LSTTTPYTRLFFIWTTNRQSTGRSKLGSSLLATELESLQQPLELRLRLADHLRVHLQAAHGV
jgi:hypothetical protein